MFYQLDDYRYVNYLWEDDVVEKFDLVENLVYCFNKLGEDQCIINIGGGNIFVKIMEKDLLIGQEVEVLWVKGLGGDLRMLIKENFFFLYEDKLCVLDEVYQVYLDKGYKLVGEDCMVGMFKYCNFCLNLCVFFIDMFLYLMIDEKYVDYLYLNVVIFVVFCKDQEKLIEVIWGGKLVYVFWMCFGWEVVKVCEDIYKVNFDIWGILLG